MSHVRLQRRFKREPILSVLLVVILLASLYTFLLHLPTRAREWFSPRCNYSMKIIGNQIEFDDATYHIEHYPEFICPQNFRNLADWIYGWPSSLFKEELETSANSFIRTVPDLPQGSIIFVKMAAMESFFSKVYPSLKNPFVLVTAQGDEGTPGSYITYLDDPNSKIIHWFGQNGGINATRSARFTHIPIGLNCYEMADSIRTVHKGFPTYTLPADEHTNMNEPSHYIQPFDITEKVLANNTLTNRTLLLNFQPGTDGSGVRRKIWNEICEQPSHPFAVCFGKPDGVQPRKLPAIYRRNRQYPLWLSPRGNGLDCHRTWEALYLDAIPIVWHSTLDPLYENLPVIIINGWEEVTEEFLRSKLREVAMKKMQRPAVYQYEKLRNAYWREMILKKSKYASNRAGIQRNRCWRARSIN